MGQPKVSSTYTSGGGYVAGQPRRLTRKSPQDNGDNVFNTKGRANEIGQSWYLLYLLDCQLPTTCTSHLSPIDHL